jgi:hypothetical protein
MHAYLPGDTPRRAGEAEQKGGENPVWQRALTLMEQGVGEVIEGALTAIAPVASASRPVVVRAPGADVLALTPGTLEQAIFPPQHMDVRVTLVEVEELVDI